MQVKKFQANTMEEAIELVKHELGPDAIILETKSQKKGVGFLAKKIIEVTAAVSEKSLKKKQIIEKNLPSASLQAMNKMSAANQSAMIDKYTEKNSKKIEETKEHVNLSASVKKITETRYVDILDDVKTRENIKYSKLKDENSLKEELDKLKKIVEKLQFNQESNSSPVSVYENSIELQDAFEQLMMQGVERRYAHELVKKIAGELVQKNKHPVYDIEKIQDRIAHELLSNIEIQPIFSTKKNDLEKDTHKVPQIVILVGKTGVGKSTTIAKLANEAKIKNNYKIGIISTDLHKPGAFEQLATYSKILNLPFRSASTIADLKSALSDFKSVDLILIDTEGSSNLESRKLLGITELSKLKNTSVYVVLPAASRDLEMNETIKCYKDLNLKGIIISKLDEASLYGCIYNVTRKSKLPLTYFATGQKVPDDLEEAVRERVVGLIMNL